MTHFSLAIRVSIILTGWLGTLGAELPALAQQAPAQQLPNQPPPPPAESPVRPLPPDRSHLEPAAAACPMADGNPEDRTYPIRKLAFKAIDDKQPLVARHLLRCAIQSDPHDKIALRQEVYLDIDAGSPSDAIGDIEALRAGGDSDPQLDAQEGYLYADQKRYDLAKAAFRRAYETGDQNLRLQSLEAIHNLQGEARDTLDIDIDSQYLHRFDDGVVDGFARVYHRFGDQSPFRVFAGVHLLRDTASRVGTLPQIFSDNAFMSGAGIAFQPLKAHFAITGEANLAYVIFSGANRDATIVSDYRAVGGYFNVFRPRGTASRFSLQANGSVGFYSRYQHDAIAYLQPQENLDLLRKSQVTITPFLQESIALDSNRLFYNNTFELIPGVSIAEKRLHGFALRAEYVHGIYLPAASSSVNPYGSSYGDFRFGLTFQKSIPLVKEGGSR